MSKLNIIQQKILTLDGGEYQKLMDEYLYKKFGYTNLEPLGSHTGTNKVTKGIPDSYVKLDNGKYILIMYGTVESTSYKKLENDIKSCLDKRKLNLDINCIEEIICCHTSTNINIEQQQKLTNLITGIKITLVSIGTVSLDLLTNYPTIASDHLSIPIDTEQIYEIDDFINRYDSNGMNAPINMELLHRESEINSILNKLENTDAVIITGKSGIGKTRLGIEVCRKYKEKYNSNVYCIKNNGLELYNDLKFYLSDAGEYLIFIDDANQTTQLQYILDYIITPPDGITVKILMTVRDYAKDRIKKVICNKLIPQEEYIDILNNDTIKDILRNNLGIKNPDYLEQITRIAKGNARLAILAGKVSKKRGLSSIYNSTDIYKYYYGNIIEKEFNSREKIIVAFIIALLGPFKYKNNEIIMKLLSDHNIDEKEFNMFCQELNDIEIVDLYMNQAIKISDQSMSDYLLYYVLIEKKFIILSTLLKEVFKKYETKITYAINTILHLFYTEECTKYIKDEVNKVWDTIEDDIEQFEYVKVFHIFNEEKSLKYIKDKIENFDKEELLLTNYDFKSKMNYNKIHSELVEILGTFKNSNNYKLAIELSIYYFKKRPSEVMDFYFLFSDRLGYDSNSYNQEYEKEFFIIESLWNASNEGSDINTTILLLKIIEKYIGVDFNKSKDTIDLRTITFTTYTLCMCNGLKRLRDLMFRIMGNLYLNDKYTHTIDTILLGYSTYSRNKESFKEIYKSDLIFLVEYIFKHISKPNFIQCKILKHFKDISVRLKVDSDILLEKYKENTEFLIYNTLAKSREIGADWREEEKKKKETIYNMVKHYKKDDFEKLFSICDNVLKECNICNDWELQQGVSYIFDVIKENTDTYVEAIKAYLKYNTPCSFHIHDKILFLISVISIEEIEKIIFQYNYEQKSMWIYEFLSCIPIESISKRHANILRDTFEQELKKDCPKIPKIQLVSLYMKVDPQIVKNLSLKLLNIALNKSYLIHDYLGNITEKNDANNIFNIFIENIDILEQLYITGFSKRMDSNGNLFIILVTNNINFLKIFIQKAFSNSNWESYITTLYELWDQENYDELMTISFKTILNCKKNIDLSLCKLYIEKIFTNNKKDTDIIIKRQILWIKNYINTFFNEIEHLKLIFHIISSTFSNHNKKDLILYFINKNKDIEIFKKIPLTSRPTVYSGSEVPYIEKDISFLEDLLHSINGIDYIEHRLYLKEKISSNEKYKQQVLVHEFIYDID